MLDDDLVYKALADPVRRRLLDALFTRDGRTLGELEAVVNEHVEMTRFGVAKHLRLLEQADLVITRREGRSKLHHLNPVPIQRINERWIGKYTERAGISSVLLGMKARLEADDHPGSATGNHPGSAARKHPGSAARDGADHHTDRDDGPTERNDP